MAAFFGTIFYALMGELAIFGAIGEGFYQAVSWLAENIDKFINLF